VIREDLLLTETGNTFALLVKTASEVYSAPYRDSVLDLTDRHSEKATSSMSSSLFILSRTGSRSGPGNQGACFTVQSVTEGTITLNSNIP
jgi:hypothetical protein